MNLKKYVAGALRHWITAAEGDRLVRRFEMAKRVRSWPTDLDYDQGLYRVQQGDLSVHVARPARLHMNMYTIKRRQQDLRAEYMLEPGLIRPGDLVIDCGANIGEFSIICAQEGARVVAFEPDPTEFAALKRNAEGREITAVNCALWKQDAEMTFYDSNEHGDSSLIDPGRSDRSLTVQARRLDGVAELPAEGPVRFIKLEAEGAEPEILQGMTETLARTEYISVDMGPERGVSQDTTVVEVSNILFAAGFRMERFFHRRSSALFRREAVEGQSPKRPAA